MFRRVAPLLLLIPLAFGSGCGDPAFGAGAGTVPQAAATATPSPSPARAEFMLLESAPPETRTVSGEVLLSPDRTSISLDLTGLQPNAMYKAHVHERTCAEDAGGPHFKFDPNGPAMPPNEVHFEIRTGPGDTSATVTEALPQPLPDRARSVVLHDSSETKIACADLPPAS